MWVGLSADDLANASHGVPNIPAKLNLCKVAVRNPHTGKTEFYVSKTHPFGLEASEFVGYFYEKIERPFKDSTHLPRSAQECKSDCRISSVLFMTSRCPWSPSPPNWTTFTPALNKSEADLLD